MLRRVNTYYWFKADFTDENNIIWGCYKMDSVLSTL